MINKLTRSERRWLLTGAVLVAIAACVQWYGGKGGDKIWLLVLSRMWLSGKTLYTELFQPNLPLITWFYAVPTWFAGLTGFRDYHILITLTLLLAGISGYLCFQLMRQHPEFANNPYRQWGQALLLAFVWVVWTNPAFFGDREHLIIVTIFPYILRFMPSLAAQHFPRRVRMGIAIMGAFGLCIRPQVVLLFAAMQLLYLVQHKSLRILVSMENLVIYGVGMLYLLSVCLLTTDYFSVMLPMALATYAETNQGITSVLAYCTSAFMLAVTLVEFRLRHSSPYRRDIYYLLGFCATCLLYVLTGNGWPYTFYPLQSMILYTTAWVLWEFAWLASQHEARGEPAKQFLFGKRACALNLGFNTALVLAVYSVVLLPQSYQDSLGHKSRVDEELMAVVADNHFRSFGMMASSRSIWPEIIDTTHAMLETRLNHLWMLTKFFTSDEAFTKKNLWILDYVAHAYAVDMTHNKPEIMIVDASEEFYHTGKKVDLIAYFSVFPEFAEAWKHYTLMTTINRCLDAKIKDRIHKGLCRYDVYKRVVPRSD